MFSLHIDTARTWRGGQNQVLQTVLGMRSAGHRAALVAHPGGELRRRASEGLELIPMAPRSEMDLAAAFRLSRVLRQLKPEIIHAHDPHAVAVAALARSMGSGPQAPLVASRRVDFHIKRNAFSRWKYRQVDRFVCASETIRLMLVGDGIPEDRTTTVHEGIDIERVEATPPLDPHVEFWLPHGAPVVGNVAALVAHKGQRHLIAAAAMVVREVPDARFIILGEGELRPALERQIHELGLDKHVVLAGFRPDVLSLHKGFDLLVLPSVTEGLGTSLLDAMACGKAIVATEAGGIPEVVAHDVTGLLVPPRDERTLAAAIVLLLKDPERRAAMGRAGQDRVRRFFSAERMVQETLAVYERLRAARRRQPDEAYIPP
jgi:glycosyltransferase involved in cell wall biosynthesis